MNKKKWIIVIVFLVVIAAVVAGIFIGRGTAPVPGQTESDKYSLTGKTAVSSSVPLETAKLLEITYKYDEGWAATGMLVIQSVTIKNNSALTIDRAYISLLIFDGKNGTGNELLKRSSFIGNVSPGKAGSSGLGGSILLDDLKNPQSFVITLESVTWKGIVSPTPSSTSPPTTLGPKETVVAFWTAVQREQYTEAEKYLSSASPINLSEAKKAFEANPDKVPQRVEIIKEEVNEKEGWAQIKIALYLLDGERVEMTCELKKENGVWKM